MSRGKAFRTVITLSGSDGVKGGGGGEADLCSLQVGQTLRHTPLNHAHPDTHHLHYTSKERGHLCLRQRQSGRFRNKVERRNVKEVSDFQVV